MNLSNPAIMLAGFALVYIALLLVFFVVLKSRSAIPLSRRQLDVPTQASTLTRLTEQTVGALNKGLKQSRNGLLSRDRLEECGLKKEPGDYILMAGVATLVAGVLGFILGGFVLALLLTLLTPFVGHVILLLLAARRRKQFADQVPDTLQMFSGGLRAGHSLLRAVDAAAQENSAPMSEELSRIVNETRIGRDLGESMVDVAGRTRSDDFLGIAQAIDIHREVGGDLAEVLDHLGDTLRDRSQVRGQIRALSAEGRMSALVLMSLPVLMFFLLITIAPKYAEVFLTTPQGFLMIAGAILMLTLGGLWLKKIIKPRF